MKLDPNGRTHEPSLRELTTELDGLRKLLEARVDAIREVVDERDRLYKERDEARRTAVDAALTAVKDQTKASFDASEKAIVKSDVNAEKWRENANEWRESMLDREVKFAAKSEVSAELGGIRNDIAGLTKSRDEFRGGTAGSHSVGADVRANIAIAVSVVGLIAMLVAVVLTLTKGQT